MVNILKKLKSHLLPAFIVNLVCGIFSLCIKIFSLANYGQPITLKSLFITPFTTGYQFHINVSLWFIFCLVIIEILACIMDRITRSKCDVLFLVLTLTVAIFCCYKSYYDHQGTRDEYLNALLRLGFLMFFFWLGICYKKYIENSLEKFINYKLSIIIFISIATVLALTNYKITINVRDMRFTPITVPNGFWVAIITPIIATLFFLGISYSLAPHLKNSKSLAVFGRSTKYVMYYHQLFFVLCSFGLGALIKLGWLNEPGFSFDKMRSSAYYTGGNLGLSLVISVLALILPVIICRFIDKQKWHIKTALYICLTLAIICFLYICSKVLN